MPIVAPSSRPRVPRRRTRPSLPAALGAVLASALVLASSASAQVEPERLRFDWIGGVLLTGEIASTDFVLDSTPFGGTRTERSGGSLDVDPSVWYGLETSWRLGDHFTLSGSWMHSRGRFRANYPSLSSQEGDFDLEGLVLAAQDFQTAGSEYRAERVMSDALTDVFLTSVVWEVPVLRRWAFPYLTAGAGIYRLKSDGTVIDFEWEGDPPPQFEAIEVAGVDPLEAGGLARISVDATDPVLQVGAGLRASISQRWGVDLLIENLTRFGVDGATLTRDTGDADPEAGRFFSTRFEGKDGTVTNWGIRLALNYAFWPRFRPR